MATLLESVSQAITPQLTEQISKALDLPSAQVTTGTNTAASLLLAAIGNKAATAEGADEILGSLKQEPSNNPLDALTDGSSDNPLNQIFGVGMSKVTSWIRDTSGIDVAPFLPLVVPLVLKAISSAVKTQTLDGAGLSMLLHDENAAFAKAQPQLASEFAAALDAGANVNERAKNLRAQFSDEEWNTLTNVPALASYAVMSAAWSSPRGIEQEMNALALVISETAAADDADTLVGLVSRNITNPDSLNDMGITRENVNEMMRDASLDALKILNARATHAESVAYKKFVCDAATRVAQATKDGGMLGIGGKPISDAEKRALDLIAAALAYQP